MERVVRENPGHYIFYKEKGETGRGKILVEKCLKRLKFSGGEMGDPGKGGVNLNPFAIQ